MARQPAAHHKRSMDQVVGDDEWDDLPLANRDPPRRRLQPPSIPARASVPAPTPAVPAPATVGPKRNGVLQPPRGTQHGAPATRNSQKPRSPKTVLNRKQQRQRARKQPRAATSSSVAPNSRNPALTPAAAAPSAPGAPGASSPRALKAVPRVAVMPTAVVSSPNGAHVTPNGIGAEDKQPRARCRQYEAGFCSLGEPSCPFQHDGRAAVEDESAWLRANLADVKSWRYLKEVRLRHNGVLPAIDSGIPPFLVIADAPCKQDVTELVCLVIQVSTGRQVGRFRRLVRVFQQPSPSPQSMPTTAGAPQNVRPGNGGVGGGATAGTTAAVNPRQGSRNPVSTALPLPELFGELQRWMVSLGLDPGPQDAGGFSERGNFRWVVVGDASLKTIPDLAGQRQKLPLPAHLRSWIEATRMCALEADAHQAWQSSVVHKPVGVAAGLKARTKTHCLPRSGLGGMLKFFGPPKDTNVPDRTRRGMQAVTSLAQCTACLVRSGLPMPITTRVTQVWTPGGAYLQTRCDELPIAAPGSKIMPKPEGMIPGPQKTPPRLKGKPVAAAIVLPTASPSSNNPVNGPGGSGGATTLQEKESDKKKRSKKGRLTKAKQVAADSDVVAGSTSAGAGGVGGGGSQGVVVLNGREGRTDAGAGFGAGAGQGVSPSPGNGGVGITISGNELPNWRRSVPVQALSQDYLDYCVRERERQFYKSAGVLPYRHDPVTGEVWILLGSEMRKNRLVLSCLGGKREDMDAGPEHTAWREFWEESGKVVGHHDRALFLSACFEGRARAMWIQSAKMAVFACELSSPGFVDLPRWYDVGGRSLDKTDTSMLALHWVSATELHRACHKIGGKVVVWMPQTRPVGPAIPSSSQMQMPDLASQQQQWQNRPRGQDPMWGPGPAEPDVGDMDNVSVGGDLDEIHRDGPGDPFSTATVLSLPLQLPLPPAQVQQQKQQQPEPQALPPPTRVETAVEPYPLLRTLITDQAFQLFFAQLAAAGSSNQRFVPPSSMNAGMKVHAGRRNGGGAGGAGGAMPAL